MLSWQGTRAMGSASSAELLLAVETGSPPAGKAPAVRVAHSLFAVDVQRPDSWSWGRQSTARRQRKTAAARFTSTRAPLAG
eukprot:CAMPEP_0171158608 /NCGR_PEP_ID=MMETSP0790-20130122/2598_1 /TAXON_ID=2925 /ORGANISM="Alexandrium catenella, Strain OF101" /LENGTH=80 /DNA_ID=CAMNT_0011623053 /DNA_START=228 /DNA_END=467 /DNA_ORIENTATION=-